MARKISGVRRIIRAAAKDPKVLQQLKKNPKALAHRFKLTNKEIAALVSADRLLIVRKRIAGTSTVTFETASTFTAHPPTTLGTMTFTIDRPGAGRGEWVIPNS
jgi:hypothetical protein